jgi:hypothetical protein
MPAGNSFQGHALRKNVGQIGIPTAISCPKLSDFSATIATDTPRRAVCLRKPLFVSMMQY